MNLRIIREALDLFSEYIEGCDHDVGICSCYERRVLELARGELDESGETKAEETVG